MTQLTLFIICIDQLKWWSHFRLVNYFLFVTFIFNFLVSFFVQLFYSRKILQLCIMLSFEINEQSQSQVNGKKSTLQRKIMKIFLFMIEHFSEIPQTFFVKGILWKTIYPQFTWFLSYFRQALPRVKMTGVSWALPRADSELSSWLILTYLDPSSLIGRLVNI